MILQVAALTKLMLEAAFDGENEELVKLLFKAKDLMKDEVRPYFEYCTGSEFYP